MDLHLADASREYPHLDSVCIEITDRCPLACGHCSISAGPARTRIMPLGLFQGVVDFAQQRGCQEFILAGGEPLSLVGLPTYAAYVHDTGALVSVYTSGNAFEESGAGVIESWEFARYREQGVRRAVFSVYAGVAAVHDGITHTPGSLEATLTSIENASAANVECEINFVPMRPNWTNLGEVLHLAADLGVSKVNCLRFVPQGRGLPNAPVLQLAASQEQRFLASVAEVLGRELGTVLRLGGSYGDVAPWALDDRTKSKQSVHVTLAGQVLPSADRTASVVTGY